MPRADRDDMPTRDAVAVERRERGDDAADPRDSVVVLVGIDRYQGCPGWELNGPVDDAVRLARWFLGRGVPGSQIYLLVAPEDEVVAAGLPVRRAAAGRAEVRDLFLRELPRRTEQHLYVHWGGHGFLDMGRRRRVHYADAGAGDSVNLDLDSLVAAYATDLVAFQRQLWLVDACLTVDSGVAVRGHEEFPIGRAVGGRDIDVLFAAGFGEPAVNLSAVRTGLFTRELLAALGDRWPPRPERLIDDLRRRVGELRAQGLTRQTPTYLWYRTALGDEGQLLQRPLLGVAAPGRPGPGGGAELALLRQVVEALLEIDEVLRPDGRAEILSLLRREMSSAVPRQAAARLDAVAIVRTCRRFPGGLAELVEAVRFVAPGDPATGRFAGLAGRLGER